MEFLVSLLTALLCVAGAFLIFMFVASFVSIATSLDKIAKAFIKWSERR